MERQICRQRTDYGTLGRTLIAGAAWLKEFPSHLPSGHTDIYPDTGGMGKNQQWAKLVPDKRPSTQEIAIVRDALFRLKLNSAALRFVGKDQFAYLVFFDTMREQGIGFYDKT